ncbi:unnamed protein product, partial [Vitis vinifera]|uniref:Trichome birefringence-like N-terminal domain-containing protein n=1 Tax=Vitis vinifera TaxID=29760 RepID=D7T3J9_VITVI
MWIYDPGVRSAPYDHKEIFKGWNCIASNKSNGLDIIKWRWKPKGCDLPRFDPVRFLERFRNTNDGFVGDSLNRNMFVSLFCTLKRVSSEVRKWRPAAYVCAIELTKNLDRWSADANGGTLESLGY